MVGCKSPQTGILNDSYVGGSFAPEMKFAGYDLIIITGKAPEPVVLWIKDGAVEFIPAKDNGIIIDLAIKHIFLFAAVGAGAVMWLRMGKIARGELAKGEPAKGDK